MESTHNSGAWVSSLGNAFGGAPSLSPAPVAPSAADSASAMPVADALSQIGSKEDKNSMMAAFSDLGLALDAGAASNASSSSAKALLAKRKSEKLREEEIESQYRARREARQAARDQSKEAAPTSALMQAIDAFAGEVSQSETFASTLHRKALPGAFAAGSRRARQKQEKTFERSAASGRSGMSVRDVKRQQRRENRRNVY